MERVKKTQILFDKKTMKNLYLGIWVKNLEKTLIWGQNPLETEEGLVCYGNDPRMCQVFALNTGNLREKLNEMSSVNL